MRRGEAKMGVSYCQYAQFHCTILALSLVADEDVDFEGGILTELVPKVD